MRQQQVDQTPLFEYADLSTRMIVRRVFKILLYFVGGFLAEIGLLVIGLYVSNMNNQFGYATLLVGLIAGVGSIFIFFRKRYYVYSLSWLRYLWWILGATIVAVVASILIFVFLPDPNGKDQKIASVIFGFILLFYGIALAGIAHLKPPLHQQIDERVRSILKTRPAQQIPLTELLARLEREFKCSDATLYLNINGLPYIEQINIPGTTTMVIRLKGVKEKLPFPQVYSIATDSLRQSVVRALSLLNEEEVDLGLFSLSRDFENTLKAYLIAASQKGKMTIPVKDPPARWKLTHMIDWARNNGIITDYAVLSYLRQERNNRAHEGMPSLAERRLLMKNVQHLAGLYIDYIKLLDDLIYNL